MPKRLVQGQSAYTPRKESLFKTILEMNLYVHCKDERLSFTKHHHSYFHFDLNAGCGFNHEVNCEGSPLVFLKAIEKYNVHRFFADFVDRDQTAIHNLMKLVPPDNQKTIFCGDNQEFIYAIPDLIRLRSDRPEFALGSILCDPNGIDLSIEALQWLTRKCQRLDLILSYPARTWLRNIAAGNTIFRLPEIIAMKRFWHVQTPLSDCIHQWMVFVGRNFKMGDSPNHRLYALDSPEGQETWRRCCPKTKQESPQLLLFPEAIDASTSQLPRLPPTSDLPNYAQDRPVAKRKQMRSMQHPSIN